MRDVLTTSSLPARRTPSNTRKKTGWWCRWGHMVARRPLPPSDPYASIRRVQCATISALAASLLHW